MKHNDTWTVGKVLTWTTKRFNAAGLESARLDAEILLASALGCDRVKIYTDYHKPLDPRERSAYRDLVRQRLKGVPTAYLVGHREFWSIDLLVDRGVLIPRPDTETLVEVALELLKDMEAPWIADIGTGSGCIALALAKERQDAHLVATDLSPEALSVAQKNTHHLNLDVELLEGSLVEPLVAAGHRTFHLVVSNPPYIAEKDGATAHPDVLEHEPKNALLAGDDGLDVLRPLVSDALQVIRPGGWLAVEMALDQAAAVEALFRDNGYQGVQVRSDLAGRDRVVYGQKSEQDTKN